LLGIAWNCFITCKQKDLCGFRLQSGGVRCEGRLDLAQLQIIGPRLLFRPPPQTGHHNGHHKRPSPPHPLLIRTPLSSGIHIHDLLSVPPSCSTNYCLVSPSPPPDSHTAYLVICWSAGRRLPTTASIINSSPPHTVSNHALNRRRFRSTTLEYPKYSAWKSAEAVRQCGLRLQQSWALRSESEIAFRRHPHPSPPRPP
jgi:hypothetical protein